MFHRIIKLLSGGSPRGEVGSKCCVEFIISEKGERYNAKIKGKRIKRGENKAQFGEKYKQFRMNSVMSTKRKKRFFIVYITTKKQRNNDEMTSRKKENSSAG